jgi:mono/diheme cytochrome c family protein
MLPMSKMVAVRPGRMMVGSAALLVVVAMAIVTRVAAQSPAGYAPAPPALIAPATVIPAPPDDPTSAKAYAVFDQHCARCHQVGRTGQALPSRPTTMLDLAALARDPAAVIPGNPDASRVYIAMLTSHAAAYGKDAKDPAPEAVEAVRDWIQFLEAPKCVAPATPAPISVTELAERALAARPAEIRADLRFISLGHLHNECDPPSVLAGWRQAVVKAVNSISPSRTPATLTRAGDGDGLLVVDLAVIGWTRERWDQLVSVYPYAPSAAAREQFGALTRELPTSVPIVRGDWLVFAGLRAPLYNDLLGLPDSMTALLSSLKIDADRNIDTGTAQRAGHRQSTVARGSRLIERHTFANGGFWKTYEFAPATGGAPRRDMIDAPLAPAAKFNVRHDASFAHFALPNGFEAFFIANADAQSVKDVPGSVAADDSRPGSRIEVAASCFACHGRGARGATDQVRATLAQNKALTPGERDRAALLYPEASAFNALATADAARFDRAMVQAGLDPTFTIGGQDPIVALADRYLRRVTLGELATELGTTPAELQALAQVAGAADREFLARALFQPVSRADVERRFRSLAELLETRDAAKVTAAPASRLIGAVTHARTSTPSEIEISLVVDPPAPKAGDQIHLRARTEAPCHLTLINIDKAGRATVIFPNDFEPSNFVEAGRDVIVPGPQAPYRLKARDPGRETIVAVCTPTFAADGIVHDFERQRFTELGDYRAFLKRAMSAEAKKERTEKAETKQPKRGPRARREAIPAPAARTGDAQGRTAVQFETR